jgi:redox-sensing transcriptional repressor
MIDEKFPVEDIRNIRQIIEKRNIDIGVICVPVESAQKVANLLIYLGIKGIVNFAPRTLEVPEDVMIEDVHISLSFKSLSFKMVNREK